MEDKMRSSFEQAAALQKLWVETMAGVTRVWGQYSPENPPPDEIKKIRKGMLDVVSAAWEEFMRTPQFMEMMRDSLNNVMTWQGMAKNGVNRIHDTMQVASKRDVEGILLAIRHVEKRMLDYAETIQCEIAKVQAKAGVAAAATGPSKEDRVFQQALMSRLDDIEKRLDAVANRPRASEAEQPEAATASTSRSKARKTTKKTTSKK